MSGKKKKINVLLTVVILWILLILILLVGIGTYVGINGMPEKTVKADYEQKENPTVEKENEKIIEGDSDTNDLPENVTETEKMVGETHAFDTYKEEDLVESLQAIYNERAPLYPQDKVIAENIGEFTVYSLNREIIEISADFETEYYQFYYNQRKLYYVRLGWSDPTVGTVDDHELYYSDEALIRWVDSSGKVHELEDSEAYSFWKADQEWAVNLYTEASAGSLTGEETAPTALSATLAFEDPETAGMIFPDSDSRYLTETEAGRLNSDQIQYAIDEIYARCGYDLGDNKYGEYFRQFSWYQPVDGSADNIAASFNEYEAYNVNLLVSFQ